MPYHGRPDATGRSSGIRTGRRGKAHRPPKGEPWVWITRDLVSSPAWRARSINCRRLIDFLMVEHMNHAGTENGRLMATYDQLVEWGMPRSEIRKAIEEAEFLGLLKCERGGRWAGSNQPSIFRLTMYADREDDPPTDEWKRRAAEEIAAWRKERSTRKTARRRWLRKQKAGSSSRTTAVRLPELRSGGNQDAPCLIGEEFRE